MNSSHGLLFLTDNTCIEVDDFYATLSLIQGAVRDGREYILVRDVGDEDVETAVNVKHIIKMILP